MLTIHSWSTTTRTYGPYQPPLLALQGVVYGHPCEEIGDGERVTTSAIVKVEGRIITTESGRAYKLGYIDPAFRKWLRANRPDWDHNNPITVGAP